MMENFCIAAFRSRQQVMAFERALRQAGVTASVITTPRAVSMGCGLSVQFAEKDLARAQQVQRQLPGDNLIGFYHVSRDGTGRATVRTAAFSR